MRYLNILITRNKIHLIAGMQFAAHQFAQTMSH
jgi:hypothetical protein